MIKYNWYYSKSEKESQLYELTKNEVDEMCDNIPPESPEEKIIHIEVEAKVDQGFGCPRIKDGTIKIGENYWCLIYGVCSMISSRLDCSEKNDEIYSYAILFSILHETRHFINGDIIATFQQEIEADHYAYKHLAKNFNNNSMIIGVLCSLISLLLMDRVMGRDLYKIYENHPPVLQRLEHFFNVLDECNIDYRLDEVRGLIKYFISCKVFPNSLDSFQYIFNVFQKEESCQEYVENSIDSLDYDETP